MFRGIDVSAAQGAISWPSLAPLGLQFAIAKAAEGNKGNDPIFDVPGFYVDHARSAGTSGQDPRFAENVAGARAAGLVVGCYSFAYPLPHQDGNPIRDPEAQAKFHFDLAGGLGSLDGELPPMLDLEWPPPEDWGKWGCTPPQLRDWALRYLDAATGLWGCLPMVYTYPDWWLRVGGAGEPAFAEYPCWPASYPTPPARWPTAGEKPLILRPWSDWLGWQFCGGGMTLPNGVRADFDVLNLDEAGLAALCRSGIPGVPLP